MIKQSRDDEWSLQADLTAAWIANGLSIEGRRCFLVAWEVMFPSWLTNHHLAKWNEPSIDFIFTDEVGTLYSLEIKSEVNSPGSAWRALAQTTHRAVLMHKSRTFEKVQATFVRSRTHEARNDPRASSEGLGLLEEHRSFFGLAEPLPREAFVTGPIARVVGARRFGRSWHDVVDQYSGSSEAQAAAYLNERYRLASQANLNLKRLVDLGAWREFVTPPIHAVQVG